MIQSSRAASRVFDRFAMTAARLSGSSIAFALAALVVVGWAAMGPLFSFSETWQLVINTGTTIITFLMVFLIQHAQNKDSIALHLKLNELVAAQNLANNRLIAAEELDEEQLEQLRAYYHRLAQLAADTKDIDQSHSMEVAMDRHRDKQDAAPD